MFTYLLPRQGAFSDRPSLFEVGDFFVDDGAVIINMLECINVNLIDPSTGALSDQPQLFKDHFRWVTFLSVIALRSCLLEDDIARQTSLRSG